jgi:hypothetical protein
LAEGPRGGACRLPRQFATGADQQRVKITVAIGRARVIGDVHLVEEAKRAAGLLDVLQHASPLNDDSVGVLAACGCFPEVDPGDVTVVARN